MYILAEGRFRFLLKNNFRYLKVAILLVGIYSICNAVRSSHFFLAVTPLFFVTFSRVVEELVFCVTKLIETHYGRRKCIIPSFRQLN